MNLTARPAAHFKAGLKGGVDIRRALLAALVRRMPCLMDPGTDAFRLLTGHAEDVPGIVVEKYGPVVVLQVLNESRELMSELRSVTKWYAKTLGVRAVYAKNFVKDRTRATTDSGGDRRPPTLLLGESIDDEIEILENHLKFTVWPNEGRSVGLFLDQRDNRSRIRSLAADKDVLNLFAYTCAFSVAAAAGGAKSTTSVDISPKHLERGRANFKLNDIDPDRHQFIRSTALDYCKRAKRQEKRFDLVIIDPPTFARSRRGTGTFSVTQDLATLVGLASALLRPGGSMMVSTNHRGLSVRGLRDRIKVGAAGRRFEIVATPPLPLDFAADPRHARTVFACFV